MEDWRLTGHEDYLTGMTFYKVRFPQFWKKAYADKNAFFQKTERYAHDFVEHFHREEEYLEGEQIRLFWHEHCKLCWDEIMADDEREFYCSQNLDIWMCPECFNDFKEKFGLIERPEEELIELLK